jgi:uncharacterized membrane protein YeaQ/YmgE (transglycosylase-associated protein family)
MKAFCRGLQMSVLAWIVLGLIAGFMASNIVRSSGQGLLLGIVLGVVGGCLFTAVGATGITGFNLYSMFVTIIGAVAVLWLYHAMSGRSV